MLPTFYIPNDSLFDLRSVDCGTSKTAVLGTLNKTTNEVMITVIAFSPTVRFVNF